SFINPLNPTTNNFSQITPSINPYSNNPSPHSINPYQFNSIQTKLNQQYLYNKSSASNPIHKHYPHQI
ncbi:hypothetical protein, partial [Bacillus pumilus]|uniref:hypothetical protein n=1 Tax=Bacillus pumilus TaxID=1408 RepID=UPI001C930CDB